MGSVSIPWYIGVTSDITVLLPVARLSCGIKEACFQYHKISSMRLSMNQLYMMQCEKLRAEAATLPGIRAELEALRRRHSAALELMGERDEEVFIFSSLYLIAKITVLIRCR